MDSNDFTKEKKKIIICCIIFSALCKAASLLFIGQNIDFSIGIIVGTIAVIVNFNTLVLVVDIAIKNRNEYLAFLLQMGRFFVYAVLGYICNKISLIAIIGYATSVIGFTIATLITYCRKGGN